MDHREDLTRLLQAWQQQTGNQTITNQVFEAIYTELQSIGHRMIAHEQAASLATCGLVNELYLQFHDTHGLMINDRRHFLGLCGRVMRQILMQHARRRKADKRGGSNSDLTLQEELISGGRPVPLLNLDEALQELAALNERQARLVELRYFVGLSVADAADALEISEPTAHRDWKLAKAFLQVQLSDAKA